MSRMAIAVVEFHNTNSAPGLGAEFGKVVQRLEHGAFYDLSFDPVLGCVFATYLKPGPGEEPQTRLYPLAAVANMVYLEPRQSKK